MTETDSDLQFMTNSEGKPTAVLVPIALWRELESERETAYLLKTDAMRTRLMDALSREGGVTIEEGRASLGI